MIDVDAPSLFRPLLPEAVRLAEMPPDRADPAVLAAEELQQVARAVPKRRLEFAAGRQLARRLLDDMGQGIEALPGDADRVPRWPQAVVGSITHCRSLCAVAVAPRTLSAGIGLDVEPAEPMKPELLPQILRESEFARLRDWPHRWRDLAGILTFSAKEALYKSIYPAHRVFLDFQDVELHWSGFAPDEGGLFATFEAHVRVPQATFPGMTRIAGRARVAHGHVGTVVVVPPQA
ncbi:MAG: 4'-phosphopantetheinyl transferase superfamily protein [Lysobacter sp.]|nr:4'-phosphopantetheinyl transferase superfamily protein [Lysobacter sp.]